MDINLLSGGKRESDEGESPERFTATVEDRVGWAGLAHSSATLRASRSDSLSLVYNYIPKKSLYRYL